MRSSRLVPLLVSAVLFTALGEAAAQEQASSPSEGLRKRVEEFYSLLQRGRVSESESYVSPDSLANFRKLTVNPFLGFEVSSVEVDSAAGTASVLVQILFQPQMGPPMKFPRKSVWRSEQGKWLLVVPEAEQPQLQGAFDAAAGARAEPPKPDELRFQAKEINLGVLREGDKPQARFSFANATDHPVSITRVDTDCPCLRVLSELKRTYGPGESGELILEFDTVGYLRDYEQTVVVKTDPGDLRVNLLIKAHVQPRRRTTSKTPDAPPSTQQEPR